MVLDRLQFDVIAVLALCHLIRSTPHRLSGKALVTHLLGIALGLDHTLSALNIGEFPGQKRGGILGRDDDFVRAIRLDFAHLLAQPAHIRGHAFGAKHLAQAKLYIS